MIAIMILACVVMAELYEMPVGESILCLFLAFFFSFMAIQCTGATDITPLTAASKSSQIILGGATKGEHWTIQKAQRLNLLGGALASIGANQSSDLVGDFRVGFLLRTPPRIQWMAQGIGTVCAIFFAPALFVLFSKGECGRVLSRALAGADSKIQRILAFLTHQWRRRARSRSRR